MQFILYVALSAKVSPFHLPALAPRKRIRGILVIFTRTSSLSLICRSLAHYMWVCQEKYLSINNILSVFFSFEWCAHLLGRSAYHFSCPFARVSFVNATHTHFCQFSFFSLSLARHSRLTARWLTLPVLDSHSQCFAHCSHSRVLFNFSTDHVSFCHKTPNLFCRLCFYKQTLIIIMWQFNTLLFFSLLLLPAVSVFRFAFVCLRKSFRSFLFMHCVCVCKNFAWVTLANVSMFFFYFFQVHELDSLNDSYNAI